MQRAVVLVGATGLVGGECLQLLLADPFFTHVVVLVRARSPVAFRAAPLLSLAVWCRRPR